MRLYTKTTILWNVNLWLTNDPATYDQIKQWYLRDGATRAQITDYLYRHLPATTHDGYPYRKYAIRAAVNELCETFTN